MKETNNAINEFGEINIKCPECKKISHTKEWFDCEVGCEDCGSHSGTRCPKCGEDFDHVWGYDKIRDNI